MKNTFKEYHQFSENEYKTLWDNCIFVFDTNTLLNMYRYSRETVNAYFDLLSSLKMNNRIWIPYQVGYEFYENRIGVINEYEKSYEEVLGILGKAKREIETKYKDHPFLDFSKIKVKMEKSLEGIESIIKDAQGNHPKWLEKDDVLDKITEIFDGNVGSPYDEKRINEIKEDGRKRYEKKIPPGFKDNSDKPDNKKYGDLILWYQIIDKAKESKKPIVFISGDVKEDWWLQNKGKRIMPLPQLKKEMYEKAEIDFHIYTADKFLEIHRNSVNKINDDTINEVKNVRRLNDLKHKSERNYYGSIIRILIPTRKNKEGDGIGYKIKGFRIKDFETFSDLLNELYFQIEEFVEPFTYDVDWILEDITNHTLITKMNADRRNNFSNTTLDDRSLYDVGIQEGLTYKIKLLYSDM
jgi:hypothetical protein